MNAQTTVFPRYRGILFVVLLLLLVAGQMLMYYRSHGPYEIPDWKFSTNSVVIVTDRSQTRPNQKPFSAPWVVEVENRRAHVYYDNSTYTKVRGVGLRKVTSTVPSYMLLAELSRQDIGRITTEVIDLGIPGLTPEREEQVVIEGISPDAMRLYTKISLQQIAGK